MNINTAPAISRREEALQRDRRVVELYRQFMDTAYDLWLEVTAIKRDKLYEELAFKSYEAYCIDRFGRRDTSINNYTKPFDILVEAGQDPAEFKNMLPARRMEIAVVAQAKGKSWTDEEKRQLIEAGSRRKPRGKPDKLSQAAEEARQTLAIETLQPVTIRLLQSQREMWQLAMDVMEVVLRSENGKPLAGNYQDELKVELILASFFEQEWVKPIVEMLQNPEDTK